jgi:competence protein ComEC
MAFAGTLAVMGGRPGAVLNAVALAALMVLAWSPASFFEPALALSFTAVLGIVIWEPGRDRIGALVQSTLGAGLATAPLVAAMGAPLPSTLLLTNMLAIPFFGGVVLPLALSSAAIEPLRPVACALAEAGIRLLQTLEGRDLLEGSTQPVRVALVIAGLGFTGRLLWLRHPMRALAVLGVTLVGAGFAGPARLFDPGQSLLVLDVGHGDASLLRSADRAWLIDTGPRHGRSDAGRYVVGPALRAEGLGRLEVMVLSHADYDHVGGAQSILEAVPVGELWMSPATYEAEGIASVRRVAARRGIPIRLVSAGDHARLPPLTVSVLWPPADLDGSDSNDSSLVLRVDGPHGCAMLPGDASVDVEHRLAETQRPCQVLKLAHHGSRSATGRMWLERLQPWLAIASAGSRSRFPLPHPEVMHRLRNEAVTLLETRREGAIRVRFTSAGITADAFLTAPLSEPGS